MDSAQAGVAVLSQAQASNRENRRVVFPYQVKFRFEIATLIMEK